MAGNYGHEKLCKAASSFLSDFHFGHVEIEAVTEVFGNYATRQKSEAAVCSAIYWRDLYYDEKGRKPCCQMSVRLFDTKKANQRLIAGVMDDIDAPLIRTLQPTVGAE
jgi:hypothetical protein